MKHFLRLGWTFVAAGGALLAVGNHQGFAQPVVVLSDTPAYLGHSSQSYLGIDMHDIDNDRATALKLKDSHGAEIVTVDHDAPANKAGLKVHDVVLEMNGQRVEGADQLRRMLRETPPGHTVNFVISRDGQQQNISVQLADRAKVEATAWSQHFTVPDPSETSTPEGLVGPSTRGFGSGFFGVFTTNGLYVGADVDVHGDDGGFGVEAVFGGVEAGDGLALLGAGAGGLLGVAAVGVELADGGHGDLPRVWLPVREETPPPNPLPIAMERGGQVRDGMVSRTGGRG